MTFTPQRVLFIPKWYPDPSDPQLGIFIREHAEAMAGKLSLSVLYAYPDPTGKMERTPHIDRSRGFTEISIPYKSQGPRPVRLYRYFQALRKGWRRLLPEEGVPELIHVHVLNRPACFAYWIKLQRGIPFIISEHWTGYIDGKAEKRSFLTRMATRYLIAKSQALSVVSERLAEALRKRGAKEPWIIPNSVQNPGPPDPIPSSPFRFLNISDMVDEHKNLSGLLDAFEKLKKERKEDIELHLVGGGPDEEKVRELASGKGLLDQGVSFYGRLTNEDVQRLIPSMSAIVVNSLFETFSVVTIEALTHGRPVAATVCGGPERIIEDGKDGVLFQKGDPEATKEAMANLMDRTEAYDPEDLQKRILERFGREKVRDRFLELYAHALKKG